MPSVVNRTGTIHLNDGENIYIKKQLVGIEAIDNDVIIRWNNIYFRRYNYAKFTAPTGGSATAVANAIAAFLNT